MLHNFYILTFTYWIHVLITKHMNICVQNLRYFLLLCTFLWRSWNRSYMRPQNGPMSLYVLSYMRPQNGPMTLYALSYMRPQNGPMTLYYCFIWGLRTVQWPCTYCFIWGPRTVQWPCTYCLIWGPQNGPMTLYVLSVLNGFTNDL